MSAGGHQNPHWYLNNGEAHPPPPIQMPPFVTSPRMSPPPWRAGGPHYAIPNAANNLSSVGAPPPGPPVRPSRSPVIPSLQRSGQPQQTNGASPPYFRSLFSMAMKRIFSERIAHADSEVVGFHREPCGPGRSRVTVTFETPDGA